MWKTRRIRVIIAVSAVVLTILVAIPKTRNSLFGLYRQQATFDGKPTSYWLAALIDKGRIRPNEASRILSEGKEAALPVLAEILRSNDSEAQTRAAFILGTIQPTSKECAALLMPSLASLKEPQAFHRVIGILIKCDREATLAALCDMFVQNTDPKQRLQITRSLARHGHDDKASIDALVRALSDPDKNVRNLVVSSLAEMADDPELILPDLQKLLNSPDSELVQTACACLSTMKSDAKPAIPALLGLLKSSDSAMRKSAVEAIKSAFEPQSQHASITDEISGKSQTDRTQSSPQEIALERQVIEAMKALLKDSEEATRKTAIECLAELHAKEIVPDLTANFDNESFVIRQSILSALGSMGSDALTAAPLIIDAVKNTSGTGSYRVVAVGALRKIGRPCGPEAVQALLEVSKEKEMRLYFLLAIGRFRDLALPAVPILKEALNKEALNHEDRWNRLQAVVDLCLIQPNEPRWKETFAGMMKDPDSELRAHTANYYWAITGDTAAVLPVLTDVLKNRDSPNAFDAIRDLADLGPEAKSTVPMLREYLKDESYSFREISAWTLGRIGPDAKAAVPELEKAAQGSDKRLRRTANESLKRIKGDKASKAGKPQS